MSTQSITPFSFILKRAARLSFSLTFSRLINTLTGFFGILMLAQLGHDPLAASALITPMQGTLFIVSISFLFSIGVVIGHAFGGKRYDEVGIIFQQGLLLATLIVAPVLVVQWNINHILLAFGQDPRLVSMITEYFRIYTVAMPPFLWMIVCQQFLIAVGKQNWIVLISAALFVTNISVAYTLIYGHFGFPQMGINGLGVTYAIQGWVSFLLYLSCCYFNQDFKHYGLFRWRLKGNFRFLKQIFLIGWPISLQSAGDLLSFAAVTLMVGWLGANALATQQIVTQWFLLLVVPIFSIAQASGILVGQARGAKQFHDIRRYNNATLVVGLGIASLVIVAFVFFPNTLIGLYTRGHSGLNEHFLHLASIVLVLTGFRLFFDAALEILLGSLRGMYDTKFPMYVSIGITWLIGIPLAYIFGFIFHWGLIGITLSGIVSMVLATSAVYWRWQVKSQTRP